MHGYTIVSFPRNSLEKRSEDFLKYTIHQYYVLATKPFLRVFLHSFCTLPPIIMVPWKMPPKGDKPVIFQAPIFHETMIMGERVGAFGVFGISILEFSSSLARPPANPLGQWRRRRDGRHIWRHQESVKM